MEMVLLMGLQGAGKTTFARGHLPEGTAYISRDLLGKVRNRSQRQLTLIEEALRAGQSVLVDNTHATVADRAPILALGRRYGAHITGYYFPPEVRASLARNAQRTGTARVPVVAIYATAKRFQPPTLAEGFDALAIVTATGSAEAPGFTVEVYGLG